MAHNKNYIRDIVNDYCVLDLETTGLSFTWDSIIEIGILKVRNNIVIDQYSQLVNPECKIDSFITKLTGITNEMVQNMPVIKDLETTLLNFLGDDIIIGHNTSFDINFIKTKISNSIDNKYIDTLQFCRKLYPELKHHRLYDMCDYLNLESNNHRALQDCMTTKLLYDSIKSKMHIENIAIKDIFTIHSSKDYINILEPQTFEFDENNFFFKKHCVFTGILEKITRKNAMQIILNIGGCLDKNVVKETNYLILGNNDYCKSIKDGKSNKHKKAEKLKMEGFDIEIIDENTFYKLLNIEG